MRATLAAPVRSLAAASVGASLLALTGRSGRVDSIFRQAVNLEIAGGLVALVSGRTGRLPNGVHLAEQVDLRALGLSVGAPVDWREREILIGDALLIDLRAAEPWSGAVEPVAPAPPD